MVDEKLKFEDKDRLGKVVTVDTSRVLISVEEHQQMTSIAVGNLIAIQGRMASEFLIGIIERVTRSISEKLLLEEAADDGSIPLGESQDDFIKAVLIGTYRTVDGSLSNTFKRGADCFPQIDRDCFHLSGGNLQLFMNLLSANVKENERLTLGHFMADETAVAVANGDKFFQRHAAILGSTGSGKSWSVALILERAAALQSANLIVFDMHGEYSSLCEGENPIAQQYRIAGPGDLDGSDTRSLFIPYWLLNREEMLALVLDRSDNNAPNQAARFTEHVRSLKEKTLKNNEKNDVLGTFTVDSPIPYDIDILLDYLNNDDTEMVKGSGSNLKQGTWFGKLTRFISRLKAKIDDRRCGFMFQPPEECNDYGWLEGMLMKLFTASDEQKGIKIIDFSEVPSDVLPIVTGVLARLLYNIQFWMDKDSRHPLTIICDEAHLYLPVRDSAEAAEKRALEAFERIAKEGRKYGVSLLVVSQRPSDVSRTILSQCNNFLVLRLTNDQDQSVVKRLLPESMVGITDILPLLDLGEALLLGDSILLPTRIKLAKPRIAPESATRQFWSEWANQTPKQDAVSKAVEALRRQVRT
ncbi:ATP-binding protein [Bisgaard Taxon 10/6]|uniref:ATP-binding protein n=1 Tax=Exercitatus varius TaxID=67857 RepID=UPI00294B561B|nr:ATP-binding protein [Exercitatus varius]MDG2938895.1 ATP-binding protein [Exercitatus varius]